MVRFFTDASYSPEYKFGIIGYMQEHCQVNTEIIKDMKNTQCELEAIIKVFEFVTNNSNMYKEIVIYTDCQRAITLMDDRSIKNELRYIRFYQGLDKVIDQSIKCTIQKVKGHSKKSCKNNIDLEFYKVDTAVRRKLRLLTK